MSDGRLPRHLAEIDAAILAEIELVQNLPDMIWDVVSVACNVDRVELVNECTLSSFVQGGFINFKTRLARVYPYKLNRGDVSANLEELKQMPAPPSDEINCQGLRPSTLRLRHGSVA